jgi:hypothetical protein
MSTIYICKFQAHMRAEEWAKFVAGSMLTELILLWDFFGLF